MRQRNQVEPVASMRNAKFVTNHVLQFCTVDKLNDRQSADGNNETRLQNPDLIIDPQRAVANFIRGWNAIGAARIFAGKTAADSGEINLRPHSRFVHSAKLFEPTEECFASGMRKRSLRRRFPWTGCLPNDHHVANDRTA